METGGAASRATLSGIRCAAYVSRMDRTLLAGANTVLYNKRARNIRGRVRFLRLRESCVTRDARG